MISGFPLSWRLCTLVGEYLCVYEKRFVFMFGPRLE